VRFRQCRFLTFDRQSLHGWFLLCGGCRPTCIPHSNGGSKQGNSGFIFDLPFRTTESVHVTVVDGHGEETKTVNNAVLMEVEKLRRATLAGLREKYREVFQEETRSRHREHLFRRIASRLQALAEGDLSERARGRAREIARDADLRTVAPPDFFTVSGESVRTTQGNRNRRQQDSRLPLPGALLTRRWKGRTLLVEVLKDGFRYENQHYSSLSAIAVAITGTRWNGLAFFGLTRPASADRKEPTHAEK
jgi:hypothetical protein